MADALKHRILRHIGDRRYQPQQVGELAQELGIGDSEYDAFAGHIESMVADGHVVLSEAATIGLPPPGGQMVGSFRLNERGFGFVVPERPTEHGDLYVPRGNTGGAMSGDVVCAKVSHMPRRAGGGRSPYVGTVIDIIKRADRHYVGRLMKKGRTWLVEVDGRHMPDPIVVRDVGAKDAAEDDKVVIELVAYPEEDVLGEGVIVEVLGPRGQPSVETESVMRTYGLPSAFEEQVLTEARAAAQSFERTDRSSGSGGDDREDLTDTFTCTIDPPDARDFDDAISLTRLHDDPGDGAWELGVHIADVSNFVKPGSKLDAEAYARGNSAYLPRRVVPMLPEVLSNGVCSLQEGVERFCKSVFIRLDENGRVVGERFANTVIRSAKRLTYLEAQALIDGDEAAARRHARSEPQYSPQLLRTLGHLNELAQVIRKRRLDAGMIVLDLPSVDLVFDDEGHVVDAVPEDDAFTHTIIEMFMVEANEAAARLFERLGVPMIRRTHADPPTHDMKDLRQFSRVAGYNIPLSPTRYELQTLLNAVRGKPMQHAIHLAVLRTLSRAEYSPALIGHFALASEHYTHFTSPIRRYPDLVVHRAIGAYVEHAATDKQRGGRRKSKLGAAVANDTNVPDEVAMMELGTHCSQTERNAEAAEHDLTNYLVLDLLNGRLGDDLPGTVTGVTGSGVFIQLDHFLVDGFVHVNDLPGDAADRWRLNRMTGALVAQRTGRAITIGDRFTVRITRVDPPARTLDLLIIENRPQTKQKRRQPKGARKANQMTMKIKQTKNRKR